MRRPRLRLKALSALLAAPALAAGVLLAAGGPAHAAANAGPGFPAQYAAPYAEVWNSPSAPGQRWATRPD